MQTLERPWLTQVIVTIAFLMAMGITISAGIFVKHNGAAIPSLSGVTTAPHFPDTPALPAGQDWTQYRGNISGTGMSPEKSISAQNVAQLARQWTTTRRAFTSTPAIVNGVIYATNDNSLYAFALATGQTMWQFNDIPQMRGATTSAVVVDAGLHLAYYGTADGRVYAVNILTGTGAWTTQIGDPNAGAFIWSSPLLVNGKVYIGLASRDDGPCVRGAVFALDAATGKVHWTHYMVRAGALGGAVWSSVIANPGAHEIIATTGNPCPGGVVSDQTDSFVGMDWNTGATHWQYKAITQDKCDCDFGQGPVDYVYNRREYVVGGNKNGTVYAITPLMGRRSTRLVWSLQIAKSGYLGYGGIFTPPAYLNGIVFMAGGPTVDGACKGGALYALRADTGAVRWRVCTAGQVVSPMSITGDVLFVAQSNVLVAYAPATGHVLWRVDLHSQFWGGIAVSRGYVVIGGVAGTLYCYRVSHGAKLSPASTREVPPQ